MTWYYKDDDEAHGPVDNSTMLSMVEQGQVSPDTEVWRPGFSNWKCAGEVPGLFVPPHTTLEPLSEVLSQPVPPTKSLSHAESCEGEPDVYGYGGLLVRIGAFIVDFIVLMGMIFSVGVAISMVLIATDRYDPASFGAVLNWISVILTWLYYAGFEASRLRGTLGKRLLGLQVMGEYGGRVSFARATGRHFAKIVSALPFFVGYLRIPFNERRQGWHDELSDCIVVITRPKHHVGARQGEEHRPLFKKSLTWLVVALGLLVLYAGFQTLGRVAGRQAAIYEVSREATAQGAPQGLLGAKWLMSGDEVLRNVDGSYRVSSDQVQTETTVFDRLAMVDFFFKNDHLAIISVSFAGESSETTFSSTQQILELKYGAFTDPKPGKRANFEYALMSGKRMGQIEMRHMLYDGLPLEQVVLFRSIEEPERP